MKRLPVVLILALATLLPAMHPTIAQDAEVTAGDVVDRETLKAFVLAAKAYGDKASSLPEYLAILQEFRTEGPWKQGSIYLFLFTTEGLFILHGADPSLEGQNLIDLEDANGVKIIASLDAIYHNAQEPEQLAAHVMVRDGNWKYIWNRFDIDELYDLDADPGEMENVAGRRDCQERIASMRGQIAEMIGHTGPGPYEWCLDQ